MKSSKQNDTTPYFIEALKSAFVERSALEKRYSLRIFSRDIGVSHSLVSRIFSGERVPSPKMAAKLSSNLKFGPDKSRQFILSVVEKQGFIGPAVRKTGSSFSENIDSSYFESIKHWFYPAILELSETPTFRPDPLWIANRLSISQSEAALAIRNLVSLKILRKSGTKLVKSSCHFSTKDKKKTTQALIEHQLQQLHRAELSIRYTPIRERVSTGITMAIDPEKVDMARSLIEDFSRSLCAILESGARKKVYRLQVALFPQERLGS